MYPPPGKRRSATRDHFNGALLHFLNRRYEYANKNRGNSGLVFMRNFILVKPGLHIIVITITKVSLGFICATKFCAGRKKSKRGQRNMISLTVIHVFTFCLPNSVRITYSLSSTSSLQCCFIITQKLLLEASKTNTSFSRLSASSSYVSLDLQQDNMHFASTLLQCFYHAN